MKIPMYRIIQDNSKIMITALLPSENIDIMKLRSGHSVLS